MGTVLIDPCKRGRILHCSTPNLLNECVIIRHIVPESLLEGRSFVAATRMLWVQYILLELSLIKDSLVGVLEDAAITIASPAALAAWRRRRRAPRWAAAPLPPARSRGVCPGPRLGSPVG